MSCSMPRASVLTHVWGDGGRCAQKVSPAAAPSSSSCAWNGLEVVMVWSEEVWRKPGGRAGRTHVQVAGGK